MAHKNDDNPQPEPQFKRREFAQDLAGLSAAVAQAEPMVGRTWPNPPVGCVIREPRTGRIVGRGAHPGPGKPHAETLALAEAGAAANGATAYVTLEPCDHHGRTPPCTQALLKAKVARVVFAHADPHAAAAGGAETLRRAGVEVAGPEQLEATAEALDAHHVAWLVDEDDDDDDDDAQAEHAPPSLTDPHAVWRTALGQVLASAEAQLGPFLMRHRNGRVWIVAKWAMTLDGRIATHTGDSKWITGEAARLDAQYWRARLGAVAVGLGTALADDPRLTYRGADATLPQPCRVVVDTHARLPVTARLLEQQPLAGESTTTGPLLIAVGEEATHHGDASQRAHKLEAAGAKLLRLPEVPAPNGGRKVVDLHALATRLTEETGAMGLLIEGGATLLGSAYDAHLLDYAVIYLAPTLLGSGPTPLAGTGATTLTNALALRYPTLNSIGKDWRIQGKLERRQSETAKR